MKKRYIILTIIIALFFCSTFILLASTIKVNNKPTKFKIEADRIVFLNSSGKALLRL